jgi:hypothetical protein
MLGATAYEELTHALGTEIGVEVVKESLSATTWHDAGIAPHVEVVTA